jgi:hypothetical protein
MGMRRKAAKIITYWDTWREPTMTYRTAINKQTHAIEYLQRNYAKPGCGLLVSGQMIRQITAWERDPIDDALTILGRAQCATVSAMLADREEAKKQSRQ